MSNYLHRQYRQKKVKHFSRDGSKITYVQNVHFDFDEDASAPYTQSDRIVALNMHMNVSMNKVGIIICYDTKDNWVLCIVIALLIFWHILQAFLQVFEREITDILQGFANRLNSRLNRTPGVRVLKRLMERIRGKRKVILFTTNSIKPSIYTNIYIYIFKMVKEWNDGQAI